MSVLGLLTYIGPQILSPVNTLHTQANNFNTAVSRARTSVVVFVEQQAANVADSYFKVGLWDYQKSGYDVAYDWKIRRVESGVWVFLPDRTDICRYLL